ncbi:RING finger protein 148-like [Salvia hispanica]|uniref:RING finger protein 148-like n=1 Tax=Salvia hispanica TaxID=49212 RepID=UPI0020099F8B|nr:RING finger protein 148-like [Salvia hispanica]
MEESNEAENDFVIGLPVEETVGYDYNNFTLMWGRPTPPPLPSQNEDGGGDEVEEAVDYDNSFTLMQFEYELLSQFDTRYYSKDDDVVDDGEDDCCVCLQRLHHGLVATLHCRHEFHEDCIGRWLVRGHDSCPLCRHEFYDHLSFVL